MMPVDVTVTNPDSGSATLVGGFSYGSPVGDLEWHTADQKEGSGSNGTFSVDSPSNLSNGDLVILLVSAQRATSTITVPSGFSLIRDENAGASSTVPASLAFWKIADNEPSSYTVGTSNAAAHVLAGRVTGHDASAPIGGDSGVNSGLSTTNSLDVPSLSPSSQALLVSSVSHVGTTGSDISISGGMDRVLNKTSGNPRHGASVQVVSSGATGTRTWSWSNSRSCAALMFEVVP